MYITIFSTSHSFLLAVKWKIFAKNNQIAFLFIESFLIYLAHVSWKLQLVSLNIFELIVLNFSHWTKEITRRAVHSSAAVAANYCRVFQLKRLNLKIRRQTTEREMVDNENFITSNWQEWDERIWYTHANCAMDILVKIWILFLHVT